MRQSIKLAAMAAITLSATTSAITRAAPVFTFDLPDITVLSGPSPVSFAFPISLNVASLTPGDDLPVTAVSYNLPLDFGPSAGLSGLLSTNGLSLPDLLGNASPTQNPIVGANLVANRIQISSSSPTGTGLPAVGTYPLSSLQLTLAANAPAGVYTVTHFIPPAPQAPLTFGINELGEITTNDGLQFISGTITVVIPEPATAFAIAGIGGLALMRRRR